MPVDTRHKRYVPTGRRCAALLLRVLRSEWRRILPVLRRGLIPNFIGFDRRIQSVLGELLTSYYLRGHRDETNRNKRRKKPKTVQKDWTRADDELFGSPVGSGGTFGGVVQAVKRAVSRIVEKITNWIKSKLTRRTGGELDRDEIRDLRRGFEQPAAESLASQEAVSLHHEGQSDAAVESGKLFHVWRANESACKLCQSLDGVKTMIGSSFGTTRNGGAIFNPPAHPRCQCTTETVAEEK